MPLNINLIFILDLFGTFAFAMSGIRFASGKKIDWFGAYIVGLVTATGGGTVRDLLLGVTPFWMLDARYLITTAIALLAAIILKKKIFKLGSTLFLFDTIGLGLYTIVGISKSLEAGIPIWVCIVMGAITGSVGGVIRDVLINEVPLLFQKDIYALSCVAGGIMFFICTHVFFLQHLAEIIGTLTVIFIRIIAVKYHLHLPILHSINDEHYY